MSSERKRLKLFSFALALCALASIVCTAIMLTTTSGLAFANMTNGFQPDIPVILGLVGSVLGVLAGISGIALTRFGIRVANVPRSALPVLRAGIVTALVSIASGVLIFIFMPELFWFCTPLGLMLVFSLLVAFTGKTVIEVAQG